MPKSTQLCSTYMSTSSNEPGSSSTSSRSRAVSRPLACCAAMRFSPPPRRAAARLDSSCSIVVAISSPWEARCHAEGGASIAVDQLAELGEFPLVIGAKWQKATKRGIAGPTKLLTRPLHLGERRAELLHLSLFKPAVAVEQLFLGGQHQLGLGHAII